MSEEQAQDTKQKEEEDVGLGFKLFAWAILIFAAVGFGSAVAFGLQVGMTIYTDLYPKSMIQTLFNCETGDNCIIKKNGGGDGSEFLRAAYELKPGDLAHIDGPCYSGCSMFADYARPRACVTRRALMGFHKGASLDNRSNIVGYFAPTYQKDLTLWVYSKGGFPNTWSGQPLLIMRYPEILRFWPLCPTKDVLAKGNRLSGPYFSSRGLMPTAKSK